MLRTAILLMVMIYEVAAVYQYLYNVEAQMYLHYDPYDIQYLFLTSNPSFINSRWEMFEPSPGLKSIRSYYLATYNPSEIWLLDSRHSTMVNNKMSRDPQQKFCDFSLEVTGGSTFKLRSIETGGLLGYYTPTTHITTCFSAVSGGCEFFEWELRDLPVAPTSRTVAPTVIPTAIPTATPTTVPTTIPTSVPTTIPTAVPTFRPTTVGPTSLPTAVPTSLPASGRTSSPTSVPTSLSTAAPTSPPASGPTPVPTLPPTSVPTSVMTIIPTDESMTTPIPSVDVETTVPTSIPSTAPNNTELTEVPTTEPAPPWRQAAEVIEEQEQVDSLGTAGAVTSVLGMGASAGTATRLVMIAGPCRFTGEDQEFPFVFHPTGWTIRNSKALGLVLSNLMIMFGFWGLCFCVFKMAQCIGLRYFPKRFEEMDTQGLVRFPSAPLFVFVFFYQGTSLGGLILIFYAHDWTHLVSGIVTTAACLVVPVLVCYQVSKDVPRLATYTDDETRSGIKLALLGRGEWVSKHKHNHWVQRYKCVVRSYRMEYAWYMLVELLSMLSLACMRAITVHSLQQCGYVKMAQAVIFFILLVLEALTWPHCRFRDATIDFIVCGTQGTALVLQAVGYLSGDMDHFVTLIASKMFLCCVVVTLIKVVVDVLSEVYIILSGSRTRLQQRQWQKSVISTTFSASEPLNLNASFVVSIDDLTTKRALQHTETFSTTTSDHL